MKRKMLIVCSLVFLSSCEKEGEFHPFKRKEKKCAIVQSDAIPTTVQKTMTERYSGATNLIWFDKDGSSFCAVFKIQDAEKKVFFGLDGQFISEETEVENDNEDNQNEDSGCECELEYEEKH